MPTPTECFIKAAQAFAPRFGPDFIILVYWMKRTCGGLEKLLADEISRLLLTRYLNDPGLVERAALQTRLEELRLQLAGQAGVVRRLDVDEVDTEITFSHMF